MARHEFLDEMESAESATRLSGQLYDALHRRETLVNAIFGVGVCGGESPGAVVLTNSEISPTDGPTPIWDTKLPHYVADQVDGIDFPKSAQAFGIPRPTLHRVPGEPCECSGRVGVLGTFVSHGIAPAMLTAGHVAPSIGTVAKHHGKTLGTVIFSQCPQNSDPTTAVADVAVIALDEWKFPAAPVPLIVGTRVAKASDVVTMLTERPVKDTIFGRLDWLVFPEGVVRDVLMTSRQISFEGDSGAPVIAGDETSGLVSIVGHVIGGSEGIASFVQEIECQLAVSKTTLRVP